MNKKEINKFLSFALIVVSFILIIHDFSQDSGYKIGNVLGHTGLFLVGGYSLYRNWKSSANGNDKE